MLVSGVGVLLWSGGVGIYTDCTPHHPAPHLQKAGKLCDFSTLPHTTATLLPFLQLTGRTLRSFPLRLNIYDGTLPFAGTLRTNL